MIDRSPRWAWGLLAVLALLGPWKAWRDSQAWKQSAKLDYRQAEEWMLDALPGIGPKTAPALCEAVREGDFSALPKSAQGLAAEVFTQPEQ